MKKRPHESPECRCEACALHDTGFHVEAVRDDAALARGEFSVRVTYQPLRASIDFANWPASYDLVISRGEREIARENMRVTDPETTLQELAAYVA